MEILLETNEDVLTVFNNWHQDIMITLDEAVNFTHCPITKDTLIKVIELIQEKPFNIDITINQEVMNGEDKYLRV